MSFADSWYRASCALLLLTSHFSMFSFYLPLSFSLSLSCFLFLSLSFSLSLSLYLCPLFLSVVARHMSSDALYQIFSSWSILLFHTISFHSSYKIHQLFTDYLLRLPSSELLEKHLFSLSGQPSSSYRHGKGLRAENPPIKFFKMLEAQDLRLLQFSMFVSVPARFPQSVYWGYLIKILVVIFFIGIYPYSLLGSNWTKVLIVVLFVGIPRII